MTRVSRPLTWILAGASLLLLGFGCKKPAVTANPAPRPANAVPSPAQPPPPPTPPPAPAASSTQTPSTPDPRLAYLLQVMRNFAAARSFRAKLDIQTPDTPLSAELQVDASKGIDGLLRVGPSLTSELILIGSDAYFRSNTSSWINLSATAEGRGLADKLRQAFALNEDLSGFLKDAAVTSDQDDPAGCRLYTLSKKDASGQARPITICVHGDLPTRISFDSPSGHVVANYSDYNQPMDIAAPALGK